MPDTTEYRPIPDAGIVLSLVWRPGVGIILDPLGSSMLSSSPCYGTQYTVVINVCLRLQDFLPEEYAFSYVALQICWTSVVFYRGFPSSAFIAGVMCEQVIDEADRMMEEIKQDWLSLVDKAVYREQSTTDSQIYLHPCQRLAPGPLTLEKYEKIWFLLML